MSGSVQQQQANAQAQAEQQNLAIRNLIVRKALPVRLPIYTQTVNVAAQAGSPLSIQQNIRNVGLLRGFLIEVTLNLQASATPTWAMTQFGPWNLLSNITFYDLGNYLRHNSPGWHFAAIQTMRQGQSVQNSNSVVNKSPWPYTWTPNLTSANSGPGFGNNYPLISGGPSTIADTNAHTVTQFYYVPIAYSDVDLRGAIYLGVVSSTANLQFTINPNIVVASGDSYGAVYSGAGTVNAATTTATITIYQDWYDQLPTSQDGAPLLPALDMSKNYQLQWTTFQGIVQGNDFPMPYGNYRWFQSTLAIFDNNAVLSNGSDVNYFSLVTANFSRVFQMDPYTVQSETRKLLGTDLPRGMYYFDHRRRPINSNQYGNIALNINASSVSNSASANVYLGYEYFTTAGSALGAGSLAGS
jgi:hypothetical protein